MYIYIYNILYMCTGCTNINNIKVTYSTLLNAYHNKSVVL